MYKFTGMESNKPVFVNPRDITHVAPFRTQGDDRYSVIYLTMGRRIEVKENYDEYHLIREGRPLPEKPRNDKQAVSEVRRERYRKHVQNQRRRKGNFLLCEQSL